MMFAPCLKSIFSIRIAEHGHDRLAVSAIRHMPHAYDVKNHGAYVGGLTRCLAGSIC
jgi:hypothetical protein